MDSEDPPKKVRKGKPSKYPPGKKNTDKYLPKNPEKAAAKKKLREEKKRRKKEILKENPDAFKKVKTPPLPKNKEYYCYGNNCDEIFKNWGDARKHMIDVHRMYKPKLKRCMTYIQGPKAEKQRALREEEARLRAERASNKVYKYVTQKQSDFIMEMIEYTCNKFEEFVANMKFIPMGNEADRIWYEEMVRMFRFFYKGVVNEYLCDIANQHLHIIEKNSKQIAEWMQTKIVDIFLENTKTLNEEQRQEIEKIVRIETKAMRKVLERITKHVDKIPLPPPPEPIPEEPEPVVELPSFLTEALIIPSQPVEDVVK